MMKFLPGSWFPIGTLPVHEGPYEAKLVDGTTVQAEFLSGKWSGGTEKMVAWRGLELQDLDKTRGARTRLHKYHANLPEMHERASNAAIFLARRLLALGQEPKAYGMYLIANAINRSRLTTVDIQWIERYALSHKVDVAQKKVDRFFEKRGGRPHVA